MMEKTKKKRIRKIISDTLFGVIIGAFVVLFGITLISKATGKTILNENIMWVKSDSMDPTFKQYSYILTKKIDGNDVEVDDVVTFIMRVDDPERNGQYNTHRVIEINDANQLVTKGDNPRYGQDANPVDRSDVVAIYKRNMPVLTFFGRLFMTPVGYVLSVVIIVGGFSIWLALDITEKKKEKKQELIDRMVKEEVERLEKESKENK